MGIFFKGMDLSTLIEVESCGGKFHDGGRQGDAVEILKGYGMNLVRLRLWNDPYSEDGIPYGAGTNDLPRTIQMARRVQQAGIPWMLDLHYSDFWADPGKQTIPKAWRGMSPAELEQAVYDFTLWVLNRLGQEKLLPNIVAVGNELSNGLLWPWGRVPDFENIARFLNAGIRAVRQAAPEAEIMLHLDNGGNNELYRSWFDSYFACGAAPPPELGVRLVPCTTIAGHCVLPAVPAKALRVGSRRVQGFLAAFCRPETPPEHWTALLDSELAGQLGIR